MTPARLRAFLAVADTGSVRAAAERLHVTESAVSAAVAALSRELGAALVQREGRGLRLTGAGRTCASYARSVLGLLEEAAAAVRGEADPGLVRLAAVTTAGEHVLPAVLAEFRTAHPDVDLRLEVDTSEQVWAQLENHEVDLVIGGRPPERMTATVRAVRANTLTVVGAPGAAAGFDPRRATWLMREAGSGTRGSCEALLAAMEAEPPTLTLGSNGAVIAGAAHGLGVTLVSRDAVEGLLAAGDLVEVPVRGTPMRRPWHAVSPPRLGSGAALLVEHLLRGRPAGLRWRRPSR